MTLEERVQSNTDRIAALEARLYRPPMNTPETHPMYRPDPNAPPKPVTDPDYVEAFGAVFGDGGRLLSKYEETTWKRRKAAWGGFTDIPESDAVYALLAHYDLLGVDLGERAIVYGGQTALVFQAPGLGYGTPQCFVLGVPAIEHAYGEAKRIDRLVELIDQRRK